MLKIFIGSIFTSNIVLSRFFGLRIEKDNLKITWITSIVLILSSICNYYLYKLLLNYNLSILRNASFILVMLIISYIVVKIIKKDTNIMPIIMTNSIILGTSLVISTQNYDIFELLVNTIGTSIGYILIMSLIYYLSLEFGKRKGGLSFRGYPIVLITLSIIYILIDKL